MTIINITKIWGRANLGKYQSVHKYQYSEQKIKAFEEVRKAFKQFATTEEKALHRDFIKYLNISEVSSRSGMCYKTVDKMLNGQIVKGANIQSLKLVVLDAIEDINKFISLCKKPV